MPDQRTDKVGAAVPEQRLERVVDFVSDLSTRLGASRLAHPGKIRSGNRRETDASDPNEWIEVRLGDFDVPELHEPERPRGKSVLARVAFKRFAGCTGEEGR
jgi:hypothetical protein